MHHFRNNFEMLPKAEQKLASDLFEVYDNALDLLGQVELIVDDAATHSGWFSNDEAARYIDGGLATHLGVSWYSECFSRFQTLEEELLIYAPDVVEVAGVCRTCAHAVVYGLAIRLYHVIQDGCLGALPDEEGYSQSSETFPLFTLSDLVSKLDKQNDADGSTFSTVRRFLRELDFCELPHKLHQEYVDIVFSALKGGPEISESEWKAMSSRERRDRIERLNLDEVKSLHESIQKEVILKRQRNTLDFESKILRIRDWVNQFFELSASDVAALEAALAREFVLAKNNRLANPSATPKVQSQNAVSLGAGRFRIDNEEYRLEHSEALVLEALVARRTANKPDLVNDTGVGDPGRILKRLCEKYPSFDPHIHLPGRKGRGGYKTHFVSCNEEAV